MTTYKNILRLSVILVLFLVGYASDVTAQVVHINGKIYKTLKNTTGGRESLPLSQNVYIFDNGKEAQVVAQKYRARSKEDKNTVNINANDVVKSDYEGHFEADVAIDGALLVFYEGIVKLIPVTGEKLTYNIEFTDEDGIILRNTTVIGERNVVTISELPPIEEGSDLNFSDIVIEVKQGTEIKLAEVAPDVEPAIYTMCFEDRPAQADYDMNDVVLTTEPVSGKNEVKLRLVACGAKDKVYLKNIEDGNLPRCSSAC